MTYCRFLHRNRVVWLDYLLLQILGGSNCRGYENIQADPTSILSELEEKPDSDDPKDYEDKSAI